MAKRTLDDIQNIGFAPLLAQCVSQKIRLWLVGIGMPYCLEADIFTLEALFRNDEERQQVFLYIIQETKDAFDNRMQWYEKLYGKRRDFDGLKELENKYQLALRHIERDEIDQYSLLLFLIEGLDVWLTT